MTWTESGHLSAGLHHWLSLLSREGRIPPSLDWTKVRRCPNPLESCATRCPTRVLDHAGRCDKRMGVKGWGDERDNNDLRWTLASRTRMFTLTSLSLVNADGIIPILNPKYYMLDIHRGESVSSSGGFVSGLSFGTDRGPTADESARNSSSLSPALTEPEPEISQALNPRFLNLFQTLSVSHCSKMEMFSLRVIIRLVAFKSTRLQGWNFNKLTIKFC